MFIVGRVVSIVCDKRGECLLWDMESLACDKRGECTEWDEEASLLCARVVACEHEGVFFVWRTKHRGVRKDDEQQGLA